MEQSIVYINHDLNWVKIKLKEINNIPYTYVYIYFIYMAETNAHADWLICGLEKVILPSHKIHRVRSCKHCTDKILNETKVFYMPYTGVYSNDEEHSPSGLQSWRNK